MGSWEFEIAYTPLSVALTIFTIVAVVNTFNLVDGIDGLAGSLELAVSFLFAVSFYAMESYGWVLMAIAMVGALFGFFNFNISKNSKIFMGGTGSLIVGL